jgi:uncharacterized membrane protein
MVVTWQNSDKTKVRLLARGNFSLEAGGLVNLLLALAVVSLSLAGLLAWQGYWPILLIAVIQLALVTWILIRAWEKAWVSEVIEICEDSIRVTCQRYREKRQYELATAWTVLELKQSDIAWYSPRIIIRSGTKQVELGSFLTSEEKLQLHKQLQRAIRKHSAIKGALDS